MKAIEYIVTDPVGLHARPAGALVKKTSEYQSNIMIKNTESGKSADAKRIMGIMALGIKQGNKIEMSFEGADEEVAVKELEDFLKENL